MPKRVRNKSSHRSIQGDTIRQLSPKDLPTGCSVLVDDKVPCTMRMTHVAINVNHAIWAGDEQPNLVLEGYCRGHRPKIGAMVQLPDRIEKQMNGDRSVQTRMRRMENAAFILVHAVSVRKVHLFRRQEVSEQLPDEKIENKAAICGKMVKQGVVTTRGQMRGTELKMCLECLTKRDTDPLQNDQEWRGDS